MALFSDDEMYRMEDPAYDFVGIVKNASEQSGTPGAAQKEEKKKVVVRKKKKKEAEGGC